MPPRPPSRHVERARGRAIGVALLFVTTFASCASTSGDGWVRAPRVAAFDQNVHSPMSCGPAALLTSIASESGAAGRAIDAGVANRADAIGRSVERYGSRPASNDARVARFKPDSGVNPTDLLAWTNEQRADLGLDARVGVYLDRFMGAAVDDEDASANDAESDDAGSNDTGSVGRAETEAQHVRRIHGLLARSLTEGAVPMVRVRCFAPSWYADRARYLWDGEGSHWIAVVGVPREVDARALGFAFAYVDPAGGDLEYGWIAAELERGFVAAKGDVEHWTWVEDRPFLLVDAPELDTVGRGSVPWFLRTVVTFDHAIVPASAVVDWPAASTHAPGSDRTGDLDAEEAAPESDAEEANPPADDSAPDTIDL